MKKYFVVFSLLCSFQIAQAQIQKGAVAVGAQLGLTQSNNTQSNISAPITGYKSTSLKIIPEVSYFLSEKFALGLGVGYSMRSGTQSLSVNSNYTAKVYKIKDQTNMVTFNPYVKYYIKLGEKAFIPLKGGFDLGFGTNKQEYLKSTPNLSSYYFIDNPYNNLTFDYTVMPGGVNKTSSYGVGIQPAFLFFPADKWGVELSLGNLLGYTIKETKFAQNINSGYPGYNPYNYDPNFNNYYNSQSEKVTNSQFDFFSLNTKSLNLSIYYFIK